MSTSYFAHSGDRADKADWQPLVDHLAGVSSLAAELAKPFGLEKAASIAGWLHDAGKHTAAFQKRLEGGRIVNRRARGQCFHQPCLGTREFVADFELLAPETPTPVAREPSTALGFSAPRDLGLMLWDIDHDAPGRPSMFFRARLEDGVLRVPQPGSPEVLR